MARFKEQPIKMVRGTTGVINVTVYGDDGSPYALKDGDKLILGVKTSLDSSDCCIKKVITEGSGEYAFRIAPEDTANLTCGQLRYDVGLQTGSDYFTIIPCSPFILTHNVTSKEA